MVNLTIPAKLARWAILAPISVPLMLRLGVEPQIVLAAYRIGDSPTNVLTPLMPYFALMVVFTQRYQRDAGIGTVIAATTSRRPSGDVRRRVRMSHSSTLGRAARRAASIRRISGTLIPASAARRAKAA